MKKQTSVLIFLCAVLSFFSTVTIARADMGNIGPGGAILLIGIFSLPYILIGILVVAIVWSAVIIVKKIKARNQVNQEIKKEIPKNKI